MGKKFGLFLAYMFMAVGMAFAQKQITGTVVDAENGEPLIGVAVRVPNTNTGVLTDANGKFSVTLPEGQKNLNFSFMGMKPASLAARDGMVVRLETDTKAMDEVMVVAYGSQKKSSFTGSASTIKSEKIEKLQVSNLTKALEGQVAGVQIASSSNTPGSSASIIVRGIGSISASQSPLIVVDGVPYEGSLNSISSQDIESMTVLKDAAANSMYGARGANGVIMITTKSGKANKAKVEFEGRWGFNARGVGNYDIVTDAGEYYEMMYEAYRNSLVPSMGYAAASQYAATNLISGNLKYNVYEGVADNAIINPLTGKLNSACTTKKWNDDWTKDPFQNGLRQEYNASINGGNDITKAVASIGYLGDEGYMAGSGFDRINARAKVDHNVGRFVRVGGNLSYAKTDYKTFGDEESNYSNIFMFSQNIAPIYPIYFYDANGNRIKNIYGGDYDFGTEYLRPYASEQNPLSVAKDNLNKSTRDNFTSRGYFEVKFLNDFTFTANIAYDVFSTNQTEFTTPKGGDAASVGGRLYKFATRYGAMNANQILDWNHEFGKHTAHVMLVHESKVDNYNYMYGHMTNMANPNIADFSNAALYQGLNSYSSEYALEGYLGKAEYNYDEKYYVTGSVRRDGSSRFSAENRWGTFAAAGAAWRVNRESFMDPVKNIITNLKLKASYGTQGNDNIGYAHAYSDLYSVSRLEGGNAAFSKDFRGNKDLTWEKQAMFNVGFELGLLNRINVNADFFIKNNKDMLFKSPIPTSEGAPSYIWRNEVDMRNTGIEVEISADILKYRDLTWSAALNLTHYKNELTRLPASKPEEEYPDGFERGYYWWKLGSSIYNWDGYEYVGVDAETGLPQYNKYEKDDQGNEVVTIVNTTSEATTRNLNKSAIPDLVGGLSTNLTWKGFDLSVQTAFQLGGYAFDDQYAQLMNCGDKGQNFHKDMFNRWTPANTNTDIPMLNFGSQDGSISSRSDFFLTSSSYFSLRNVTLGYSLPKNLMNKVGAEELRFYLAGDNIWLKSARKGFDPRQSFSGSTGYNYSAISTYSLGVKLSF